MLPFLREAQDNEQGSASDSAPVERTPDDYDVLESAAHDLIQAVQTRDIKAVASALRAAFDLMNNETTEETSDVYGS